MCSPHRQLPVCQAVSNPPATTNQEVSRIRERRQLVSSYANSHFLDAGREVPNLRIKRCRQLGARGQEVWILWHTLWYRRLIRPKNEHPADVMLHSSDCYKVSLCTTLDLFSVFIGALGSLKGEEGSPGKKDKRDEE